MTDRHASAHRIRKGRSAVRQQGHHMTADRETVMSADTVGSDSESPHSRMMNADCSPYHSFVSRKVTLADRSAPEPRNCSNPVVKCDMNSKVS